MKILKTLFYKQYIWIAMASLALLLLAYGELTGTRLLGGTATEQWKPSGPNQHNHINHK